MTSWPKCELSKFVHADEFPLDPVIFEKVMREIVETYEDDEEECHLVSDELMMTQLSALGYDDGVFVFEYSPRWYR